MTPLRLLVYCPHIYIHKPARLPDQHHILLLALGFIQTLHSFSLNTHTHLWASESLSCSRSVCLLQFLCRFIKWNAFRVYNFHVCQRNVPRVWPPAPDTLEPEKHICLKHNHQRHAHAERSAERQLPIWSWRWASTLTETAQIHTDRGYKRYCHYSSYTIC